MRFILSIIFLLSSFIDVKGQKNYIIPEPQNITFPESKQNGFRLSKKTSIEVQGIDISKSYVSDFISFVNFETGFDLKSKINKKSNILLRVTDDINELGNEGYKISILPKESLKIDANTEAGLFYGIQTLKQIIHFAKRKRNEDSNTGYEIREIKDALNKFVSIYEKPESLRTSVTLNCTKVQKPP